MAGVVAWCYEHEVPIVPRGGGTGFAAGAVPVDGGVVLALERMRAVRAFEPLLWRICVEAGLSTAEVRRLARENGLFFPPDPGAAEQSQIGGNIATNAGGPHAFKYGVTGAWVTGLEAVVAPGEIVEVGGPIRKDVAGYDLKSLLIGSEGTLGVITAAWLNLLPAPEATLPVVAFHAGTEAGCRAIEGVLGAGLTVAALEYLDGGALAAVAGSLPGGIPDGAGFMVIAEADGSRAEVSEDIVVPLDCIQEAIEETVAIGTRHGLEACSWGHAGDGNLHSTFLVAPDDRGELERAHSAAEDLFELAARLGGSISGEHGVGWVKRGQLARQWSSRALELHKAVKWVFDPKGLLNPEKKIAA